MSRRYSPPPPGSSHQGLAIVSGIAGVLFGIIVGYLIAKPAGEALPVAAGTPQPIATPGTIGSAGPARINEQELQAYRDILRNEPTNLRAATELGNRLYDASRYPEAVIYYEIAFKLDPSNINVSTDLGTALWYSGRPDEALAQFEKSLGLDPSHPQTLFNRGIVRMEGKKDPAGALESWDALRAANPTYETARVSSLIDDARRLIDLAGPANR